MTNRRSVQLSNLNQSGMSFHMRSRSLRAHVSKAIAHALHSLYSAALSCPSSSATYSGSVDPRS